MNDIENIRYRYSTMSYGLSKLIAGLTELHGFYNHAIKPVDALKEFKLAVDGFEIAVKQQDSYSNNLRPEVLQACGEQDLEEKLTLAFERADSGKKQRVYFNTYAKIEIKKSRSPRKP